MKTKSWIIGLGLLLVVSLGLGLWLLRPGDAATLAEVRSGGELIKTVDLRVAQSFTVTTAEGGENTVTVANGKIAVTAANCPDHYCMHRGWCNSGAQIVCLPNRLTITFLTDAAIDAVA